MAKKPKAARRTKGTDRRLRDGLDEAHALMSRQQWQPAQEVLETLDRAFPQNKDVLTLLMATAARTRDLHALLRSCERLTAIDPKNPDAAYLLITGYLGNGYPALTLIAIRRALAAHPADNRIAGYRPMVDRLQEVVELLVQGNGFSGADGFESLALHEEVRLRLAQARFVKAAELAEKLIARRPQFAAAYNNGADAYYHDAQLQRAVALTERLLGFDPDNVYAVANLVRLHLSLGRREAARQQGERLKAMQVATKDHAVKQAESLALLGDDEATLAVCTAALPMSGAPADDAMLHHLYAVAAYRQGRTADAEEAWHAALQALPGFELARGNLDDLKLPIGQRNAPWIYPIQYFIPRKLINGLLARLKGAKSGQPDAALRREAARYAADHPELEAMLPIVFEHSDGPGRETALTIADLLSTPAALATVRDFAIGKRGADPLRFRAATQAERAGLFPDGPPPLACAGAPQGAKLHTYEISGEAVRHKHAPGVHELIAASVDATAAGDAPRAAELLRRALSIDANDPVVLNNLAAAHEALGQRDEAEALTRRAVELHPDYLFARTALANLACTRGNLDEARALLAPLMERKRFHFGEFAALCSAKVNVHVSAGEREPARQWLGMWRQVVPDHPLLKSYEKRLRD